MIDWSKKRALSPIATPCMTEFCVWPSVDVQLVRLNWEEMFADKICQIFLYQEVKSAGELDEIGCMCTGHQFGITTVNKIIYF